MPVNDKKRAYGAKLVSYIENYKAAFVVTCDNVGSTQMQQIRVALRGSGVVLMGKNTTIRKVVKDFLKKNEGHPIEKLLPQVVGNMGLIFTNGDLPKLRDLVSSNKVPAPARIGALAPIDVFVEPGPTGCDPGQTAWFQALNIPTKINKGQIEMISRVHLIHSGNKVTDSQAALLQKLNIRPFSYGLVVTHVYDAGEVYEAAALDISETDIISKFMSGVSTFAAVALGLGLPNKATVVHSINNAYKALLSIGMGTDYSFPKSIAFLAAMANVASSAAAAPAAGGAAPAAAAAKVEAKKEEEEEEEVGGAGGLFGDDDDF